MDQQQQETMMGHGSAVGDEDGTWISSSLICRSSNVQQKQAMINACRAAHVIGRSRRVAAYSIAGAAGNLRDGSQ